jgi:hypothetical protein
MGFKGLFKLMPFLIIPFFSDIVAKNISTFSLLPNFSKYIENLLVKF